MRQREPRADGPSVRRASLSGSERTASHCVPALEDTTSRGSGLLDWLQVSVCHTPLLPSQPHGHSQSSIIDCGVRAQGQRSLSLYSPASQG